MLTGIRGNSRLPLILMTILVMAAVDQVTKILATVYLSGSAPIRYWNDSLWLIYAENPGMFMSLGSDFPKSASFWLYTVFVIVVLSAIFVWLLRQRTMSKAGAFGYSLILAGGVGNWFDRVTNDGAVIDFLHIGFGFVRTGIFNVADISLVAGVGILIYLSTRVKPKRELREKATAG